MLFPNPAFILSCGIICNRVFPVCFVAVEVQEALVTTHVSEFVIKAVFKNMGSLNINVKNMRECSLSLSLFAISLYSLTEGERGGR